MGEISHAISTLLILLHTNLGQFINHMPQSQQQFMNIRPSFCLVPVLPVFLTDSLPAKSTKLRVLTLTDSEVLAGANVLNAMDSLL